MSDATAMFIVLFCGLALGGMWTRQITEHAWEVGAIAHGAAHYDQTTGKFTWNNPPVSTPTGTTR